ncbi:MAG: hypothetical protein ACLFNZ_05310 [Spirochaetaceae bacterium]
MHRRTKRILAHAQAGDVKGKPDVEPKPSLWPKPDAELKQDIAAGAEGVQLYLTL